MNNESAETGSKYIILVRDSTQTCLKLLKRSGNTATTDDQENDDNLRVNFKFEETIAMPRRHDGGWIGNTQEQRKPCACL
jgi:hypothetical protein